MKKGFISVLALYCAIFANAQNQTLERSMPFDANWLFVKDSIVGAEATGFDDSKWRTVNLPHDWSIEDLPNQATGIIDGPFDKNSIGQGATGFTDGGTGWYRKKFMTEASFPGKWVTISFDGVYMNSEVWLNGHYVGNHPYGYTPFYYDLTSYLNPVGQQNVLAVKVRNEGKNSRWYSGSGIYRHVWLNLTNKIHIDNWGVYITTPQVSERGATIQLKSSVVNNETGRSAVNIVTTIISPEGKTVAQTRKALPLPAGGRVTDEQHIVLSNCVLWSVDNPVLYIAITEIESNGKIIDHVKTRFGIRSIHFDGSTGFLLNGKRIILKGGCIHHDNGPLGAAAIDRAEERKIEILKKAGYNAIRSSHNPPSQQLLDACDRLGMLVLDEAFDMWELPKNPQDYHLYFDDWWQRDLDAMILRDRNHPSVIMWSIGNEIYEAPDTSGYRMGKLLAEETRRLDPTRPVTEAIVYLPPYTKKPWQDYQPHLSFVDIDGYNYFLESQSHFFVRDSVTAHRFETEHEKNPSKTFIVTEYTPGSALENWKKSEQYPYLIGTFKWTAIDYMGEAGIGKSAQFPVSRKLPDGIMRMALFYKPTWPVYNAYCGDFDLIGNKKAASYYQDVVWGNSAIEMLVHYPVAEGMKEEMAPWGFPDEIKSWSWPGQEGRPLQVSVYSRAPIVRLLLNGKVIDEQKIPAGTITASFNLPYQPGILRAVNIENGKETNSIELKTTGAPKKIRLIADRANIKANGNDLSYIAVEIIDESGKVVPYAALPVQFSISGPGGMAGAGNGSPTEATSFQQPVMKTMNGKCLVIVRPTGKIGTITLKATTKGLQPSQITVTTHS